MSSEQKNGSYCSIPVYAGFPSPAEDYIEQPLDLNRLMVSCPPATYFLRVVGNSMAGAGIFDSDLLVVDRSLDSAPGDIVVAASDAGLTVKRIETSASVPKLISAPLLGEPEMMELSDSVRIWGVVRHVIHSFK